MQGRLYPEDCPEKDPVPARESLNFWCRRSFRQDMLVLLIDDSPIMYSNHEVNSAGEMPLVPLVPQLRAEASFELGSVGTLSELGKVSMHGWN